MYIHICTVTSIFNPFATTVLRTRMPPLNRDAIANVHTYTLRANSLEIVFLVYFLRLEESRFDNAFWKRKNFFL